MSIVHKTAILTRHGRVYQAPLALSHGRTSSSKPLATTAAGVNFIQAYTKSTDTTGADSRCLYLKHFLAGTAASGECARIFTQLDTASAVAARGMHVSLAFGASVGNATGEASVIKATLHITDKAFPAGGTYGVVVAEAWVEGNSSSLASTTSHSLFRGTVGGSGNATAKAKVKYAFAFDGITDATAGMVHTGQADSVSDAHLQVLINGAPYTILMKSGATP